MFITEIVEIASWFSFIFVARIVLNFCASLISQIQFNEQQN